MSSTASSEVHPLGDLHRADVGIGHAHVLGLAAVVAAGGMGVAEDAADRGRLRVGLVAVAEQALLAEMALAAGDVERHEHLVADLEVLDGRSDLLDDAAELVAEGRADARVGHLAVVEVQVGAADAGARDPDDGVLGVLDRGIGLLVMRTRMGPRNSIASMSPPEIRDANGTAAEVFRSRFRAPGRGPPPRLGRRGRGFGRGLAGAVDLPAEAEGAGARRPPIRHGVRADAAHGPDHVRGQHGPQLPQVRRPIGHRREQLQVPRAGLERGEGLGGRGEARRGIEAELDRAADHRADRCWARR